MHAHKHTRTHVPTHTQHTHISFLELVVRWFLRSKWFPSLNDCPWLQSTKHKSYFNYVETVDVLYVHTLHTWYMIHVATWACVLEVFCSSVNRIDYPPPPPSQSLEFGLSMTTITTTNIISAMIMMVKTQQQQRHQQLLLLLLLLMMTMITIIVMIMI